MKLNKFIFPAPASSYSANQLLGEIIYIPRAHYTLRHENRKSSEASGGMNFSSLGLRSKAGVRLSEEK